MRLCQAIRGSAQRALPPRSLLPDHHPAGGSAGDGGAEVAKGELDVPGQGIDTAKDKLALAAAKRLPKRVQYWAAIELIGRFLSSKPEVAPTEATIADLMAYEE